MNDREPGVGADDDHNPLVGAGRSIVAAGGWCAPTETIYDIAQSGSHRPINHIVINDDIRIGGDQFEMGSLKHNVDEGTVTITFVDVQTLMVAYTDAMNQGSEAARLNQREESP